MGNLSLYDLDNKINTKFNSVGGILQGNVRFSVIAGTLNGDSSITPSVSSGISWEGLGDSHKIFVEEYSATNNTRLVIQNEGNGDSDYFIIRTKNEGTITNVLTINSTQVESYKPIKAPSLTIGTTTSAGNKIINFLSSGNNVQYDSRIIASGGNTTDGKGTLNIVGDTIQANGYLIYHAGNLIAASKTVGGLMSSADKTKLDNINLESGTIDNALKINGHRIDIDTVAPSNPAIKDVWIDLNLNITKYWDGTKWATLNAENANTLGGKQPSEYTQKAFSTLNVNGTNVIPAVAESTLNINGSGVITVTGNNTTKAITIGTTAEENQNTFSNVAVSGQSTVAADSKTDTLTLVAGSNINITTDAASDSITIANTYSHPTSDGNLHVPVTSTTNDGKVLRAGSTAGNIYWDTLTANKVGAVPASTTTITTGATANWYRIATSAINIGTNSGIFKIDFSGTGVAGRVVCIANCFNGSSAGTTLNVLSFTSSNFNLGLTKVRVVYNTTPTGNYAYVDVYNPSALAITYVVDIMNPVGWSVIPSTTTGTVNGGYSYKEVVCSSGIYSSDDIVADKQIKSNIITGTKPIDVLSTTLCNNLNAEFLSGLSAPSSAIVGIDDTQTLANKILNSPKIMNGTLVGTFNDSNSKTLLSVTATPSAVNYLTLANSSTNTSVSIGSTGLDANVNLNLTTKGLGVVQINGIAAVTISGTQTLSNKTYSSPIINGTVYDSNSKGLIGQTATTNAVNYINIANAATGGGPTISAIGTDTNINLNLVSKGTGVVNINNVKAADIVMLQNNLIFTFMDF